MAGLTVGIQVTSTVIYALILGAIVVIWRKWPDTRGLLVFPALWALFGIVYYVFLLSGRLSAEATLLWGAVHRLLVGIMVFGGLLAMYVILATPEPDSDDDN